MIALLQKIGLLGGMVKRESSSRPSQLLELYSFEACPACRRVRRVLTELDIDYVHRSCPRGDSPKRRALAKLGGREQVPFLIDPNTGVSLYESREIVRYLEATYGAGEPSPALQIATHA